MLTFYKGMKMLEEEPYSAACQTSGVQGKVFRMSQH